MNTEKTVDEKVGLRYGLDIGTNRLGERAMINTFKNICKAHEHIATINACNIKHHGFVMLDDVIVSKTNRGYLETQKSVDGTYKHILIGLNDMPVSLIAA